MLGPTIYIEAYACSEHDAGPAYGSFLLNENLVHRLLDLKDLCSRHNLTETREWRACNWGPGNYADHARLQSDEMVVSGGCFWFRAVPKHVDYAVETRLLEIEPVLNAYYDWKEGDPPLRFGKYSDEEWDEILEGDQETTDG